MGAHTPGPWVTRLQRGIDADCPATIEIGQPSGERLFVTAVQPKDGDVELAPRNAADAMLIAAAPDLLAKCEAALSIYDETARTYEDAYEALFKGGASEFWESVRAAIAKARGE